MKTKTYKPKKIGWKWYFILYIVTKILWHMGLDSPWLIITAIVVAIVIFMINRSREKRFKRAIEECKEALQDINNLYVLSNYSTSALNVEDKGLKCMLAQLILEKAKSTPAVAFHLNAPIAKGRPCLFVGKMKKVPHKQIKGEMTPMWDKAENVSVYVFNNALEWMSDTKHDTKSLQNILNVKINESGDSISILLRGNNGMLHFKGNNAIALAAVLTR